MWRAARYEEAKPLIRSHPWTITGTDVDISPVTFVQTWEGGWVLGESLVRMTRTPRPLGCEVSPVTHMKRKAYRG